MFRAPALRRTLITIAAIGALAACGKQKTAYEMAT